VQGVHATMKALSCVYRNNSLFSSAPHARIRYASDIVGGKIFLLNLSVHKKGIRPFSSSKSILSTTTDELPFYGAPRSKTTHESDFCGKRFSLFLQNAAAAFRDPTRADAVAAVGELTGTLALSRMHQAMMQDTTGQQILKDRPIVSKAAIPYERFIQQAATVDPSDPDITFGQAYGCFLNKHGFDPDERDQVKYIDDPDLAYVMLRYRQCHDFWHTLTALPPTVLGELGLKWLELFQTGLPLAALSSTAGSLSLPYHERHVLWNIYLPWAKRMGQNVPYCALMNVYYEKEWDTPLRELRERLLIEPAPQVESLEFD